jgi:hypothetical protein
MLFQSRDGMIKTLLMMGCLLILFTVSVDAQLLSPVSHLEGKIDASTNPFFVGRTSISGVFQGYQLDSFGDVAFFEGINILPLFGSSTFEDINSVVIVDVQDLKNKSLEEIIDLSLERYSNVKLKTESGLTLFGTNNGKIELQSEFDFAVTSILSSDMIQGTNIPFLTILTTSELKTQHTGWHSLLIHFSNRSGVVIEDSSGNVIWDGDPTDKCFLIDDTSFTLTQKSSIFLFPLISSDATTDIKLSLTPSNAGFIDISSLLEEISTSFSYFGGPDVSDISQNIQGFDELLTALSAIANGAMVLTEYDGTFQIDNSPQTFSGFGFARANNIDVTISRETQESTIEGEYKLVFLGDHFYTVQAKESEDGVAFPFPLLLIWILAFCLYLFFRFYIKINVNVELDGKIKKYTMIFHIVALIIAFILLDREISFQFGVSAIDAILGQGVSLVFAAFIGIELIIWVLGFILLAIPVRIITNSGLQYFYGVGKGGKSIGKGVGALFIWVFCAFYVKLFVNVILLIINPGNLFPMG